MAKTHLSASNRNLLGLICYSGDFPESSKKSRISRMAASMISMKQHKKEVSPDCSFNRSTQSGLTPLNS